MTNTHYYWETLKYNPDELLSMEETSPEMEAYALRRLPFLLHEKTDWKIDPEYVCPGISVWAKAYWVPISAEVSFLTVVESSSAWLPFERLAFMPPKVIDSSARARLKSCDLQTARQIASLLSLSHWRSLGGPFPKVDYDPLP